MLARDIIIIDQLPERIQDRIINKAINYALISISFTYNRMDLSQLSNRIQNISKGKIAEYIFHFFMTHNKLDVNFSSCQTPFYMPDKRDFLMAEYEWDIKNNFVRKDKPLHAEDILNLPALIPNRDLGKNATDQWAKRTQMLHPTSQGARYVFTFMERPKQRDFMDVKMHSSLLSFYENIRKEFPYFNKEKPPFTESWFWNEMSKVDFPRYQINHPLSLVITSWAGKEHFHYFYHTEHANFNGLMYTKIRNKTMLVHSLPAFSALFPKLRTQIEYGRFL